MIQKIAVVLGILLLVIVLAPTLVANVMLLINGIKGVRAKHHRRTIFHQR
jgi:hypothetical protein